MNAAGFSDFERGERGSTAEHLSVLEYKTQQEAERAATLEGRVEKQQAQLVKFDKKLAVSKQAAITYSELEDMAKRTMFGKMEISPTNWEMVLGLAKEGVVARAIAKELQHQLTAAKKEIHSLKNAFNLLFKETRLFSEVSKIAPKRVTELLQDILNQNREQQKAARTAKTQKPER